MLHLSKKASVLQFSRHFVHTHNQEKKKKRTRKRTNMKGETEGIWDHGKKNKWIHKEEQVMFTGVLGTSCTSLEGSLRLFFLDQKDLKVAFYLELSWESCLHWSSKVLRLIWCLPCDHISQPLKREPPPLWGREMSEMNTTIWHSAWARMAQLGFCTPQKAVKSLSLDFQIHFWSLKKIAFLLHISFRSFLQLGTLQNGAEVTWNATWKFIFSE